MTIQLDLVQMTPPKHRSSIGQEFIRDERGSMVVFCLFMFMMMLVLGGMAVDYMRAESQRATVQGVADRAALAAAKLRHSRSPEQVAINYFEKAGHINSIVGAPSLSESGDSKTVTLKTQSVINTYFLQFLNINSTSTSTETIVTDKEHNIEVSLVLDTYKIDNDEIDSANIFAEKLFETQHNDNISLSFVPFSSSVNVGEKLASELGTSTPLNTSSCLSVDDFNYNSTEIDLAKEYEVDQQVDIETSSGGGVQDPICPKNTDIIPLTNDLGALSDRLNDIDSSLTKKPNVGPAIHTGLKLGAALLDPSMRQPLRNTNQDNLYIGHPLDYDTTKNHKVMVLVNGDNIADIKRFDAGLYGKTLNELLEGNALLLAKVKDTYDLDPEQTVSELLEKENIQTLRGYFADIVFDYLSLAALTPEEQVAEGVAFSTANIFPSQASDLDTLQSVTDVEDNIKSICKATKDKGIIIYTVSYKTNEATRSALSHCASSPNHFFETELGSLETVMNAVALHISNLRLSL